MTSSEADSKSQKSNQDRYQEAKNYIYVEPKHRRPMWIGALIGLIIGLIIGWVIWPVQWTNAYPTDLADEPKAEYLSSVADAYVAVSDEQALDLARRRLSLMGSDPAADIQAAVAYYEESGQPNNLIRINNLNALATDLGYSTRSGPLETDSGSVAPQEPTAPAAGSEEASDTADTGSGGWFRWLLIVLTAALLIVGGLAVIRALSRRRHHDAQAEGEYDIPPQIPGFEDDQPSAFDDSSAPIQDDQLVMPVAPPRESTEIRHDDYVFSDDPEEVSYRAPRSVSSQIDLTEDDSLPIDYSVLSGATAEASRPATTDNLQPPGPSTIRPDREPIATFSATYQMGMPDYDQAFPVTEPESERYIGECGMGVNSKSSILHGNTEQVIALDVWLFDKEDERHIGSHIRVLLSEYAIDHKVDDKIADEREGDPSPIVAQPDTQFTLKGSRLQLDCTIIEVNYVTNGDAKGIFKDIVVDMEVSKS